MGTAGSPSTPSIRRTHSFRKPSPPLPKGQVMGLVGEGPYYLVLKPPALDRWWPKVERLLPEFPRRYEVRLYPDGSRAMVAWTEALKTCYKRVLRG